jgi:outer membrane lipoprotein-sorting protein
MAGNTVEAPIGSWAAILPLFILPICLSASAAEPGEIVARHLARFDAITTLALRVERQTTERGKTVIERWSFYQKGSDRFRIECEYPLQRTVVANPSELWEFVPDAKKAVRTHLAALAAKEREALLRPVLQRVAVDGLRFDVPAGDVSLRYLGLEDVGGRAAHGIECERKDEKGSQAVRGWIDAERGVLLRTELIGRRGQKLAQTVGADFFEAAPGLWFPRTLTIQDMSPRGASQTLTLKRVAINGDLPDGLFTLKVPGGTEVVGEATPARGRE